MQNQKSKKFFENGFTIVEAITAVFVFSLIAIMITAIFARAMHIKQRIFAVQKIQDNAMYILEKMAKEIRDSEITSAGPDDSCNPPARTALSMDHPIDGTITYGLSGAEGHWNLLRNTSLINSGDVEFVRLNFCITGSGAMDNMPTKVTVLATMRNKIGRETQIVNLQTTVTSRFIKSEFEN